MPGIVEPKDCDFSRSRLGKVSRSRSRIEFSQKDEAMIIAHFPQWLGTDVAGKWRQGRRTERASSIEEKL
jgi:hypothetical protein